MPEFLKHLKLCPACGRDLGDHLFSFLASTPVKVNEDPRAVSFLRSIKDHNWREVMSFQQWEGGYDDYELYGIRAEDHPLVLVTVWNPFELFYNEKTVDIEVLNETDSREVLALAGNKEWNPVRDVAHR